MNESLYDNRKCYNKKGTYKGLTDAMETAINIYNANIGISFVDLADIFSDDPIINPYYWEITDMFRIGRDSLRFEGISKKVVEECEVSVQD